VSHTPAEILRQFLVTGTGAPFDVPNSTGATWPLYVSLVPDADDPTEDDVGSVIDSPGVVEDASMTTGRHLVHHGVELIVRAKNYADAYAKAREAVAWVEDALNEAVSIGLSAYTINAVGLVGDLNTELEDGHKRRHLVAVNFLVTLDGASGGTLSPRSLSANVSEALDLIGSTRGSVLYRGASGWAALAPGTSGHFLKSNGAGADPSYAAAAGGSWSGTATSDLDMAGYKVKTTNNTSLTVVSPDSGGGTDTSKIVLDANATADVRIVPGGRCDIERTTRIAVNGTNGALQLGASGDVRFYRSAANTTTHDNGAGGAASLNLVGVLKVSGTQVVGSQGAAVADATGAGDVVAQLNTLLARLRTHGLIAT